MTVAVIFLAAFVATTLMTAFSYLISETFRGLYKEPVLLHYLMIRFNFNLSPKEKTVAGWTIHYTIGLLFVLAWYILWKRGLFELNWLSGLIYGCVIGIIGIGGWAVMFILSDHKPKIDFKGYYLQLFFAHIVFGLTTWIVFEWLMK
ncbi:MAG: hypothetical protein ACM3O8_03975 [Methylococcaceae bacterium]|nr:hypothetical protein [Prolixibacteraceae bacterium]